ncbi:MAG: NAD(P)H-dependent oxidoreductase [Eggerthella lenta]
MNVSVILGHPYDGSFNAAIAQTVVQTLEEDGHAVAFHDLHAEGFNPVIPPSELVSDVPADDLTALHQREIKEADGIVVVHPNWWGQPPAILKGWVDRVLRRAWPTVRRGRFRRRPAHRPAESPRGARVQHVEHAGSARARSFGDPLQRLWRDCICDFCGVTTFDRVMFRVVADSTPADRRTWLEQARTMTRESFPSEWNSAARSD